MKFNIIEEYQIKGKNTLSELECMTFCNENCNHFLDISKTYQGKVVICLYGENDKNSSRVIMYDNLTDAIEAYQNIDWVVDSLNHFKTLSRNLRISTTTVEDFLSDFRKFEISEFEVISELFIEPKSLFRFEGSKNTEVKIVTTRYILYFVVKHRLM